MTPDEVTASLQNPVIVYVAIGIAVVSMIVSAFPKLLGPLGQALMEWSKQQRERRIAAEDYRIKDLRDDNDYLVTRVNKYVSRERRWAIEADRARVWMRKARSLLMENGVDIEPFPELMTPDPPTEQTHKETDA